MSKLKITQFDHAADAVHPPGWKREELKIKCDLFNEIVQKASFSKKAKRVLKKHGNNAKISDLSIKKMLKILVRMGADIKVEVGNV